MWSSVETGGRHICCHRSNVTVRQQLSPVRSGHASTLAWDGSAFHGNKGWDWMGWDGSKHDGHPQAQTSCTCSVKPGDADTTSSIAHVLPNFIILLDALTNTYLG